MDKETLGENIKKYRIKKNMTQKELATELGMAVQSLSRLERGLSSPSFENYQKIMESLEISPNQLFLSDKYTEELNKDVKNDVIEVFDKLKYVKGINYSSDTDELKKYLNDLEEFYSEELSEDINNILNQYFIREEYLLRYNSKEVGEFKSFIERLTLFITSEKLNLNSIRASDEIDNSIHYTKTRIRK